MNDSLKQLDDHMQSIEKTFKIAVSVETVTANRLSDLLTGALEGGSNYWYVIENEILAEGINRKDFAFPHIEIPFTEGCALIIGENEQDPSLCGKRLDWDSMQKGLQIMYDKYNRHYLDFINENDDAETADVFLQCCLFGEIIFG